MAKKSSVYEGKTAEELKPKVSPPSAVRKPKPGISDKKKRVLVEIDGENKKQVREDVIRKPGCIYIYEEAK